MSLYSTSIALSSKPALCGEKRRAPSTQVRSKPPRRTQLADCTSRAAGADGLHNPPSSEAASTAPEADKKSSESIWVRVRNFFLGGKLDKERIKALGLGALISYGFISNVTYGACVTIVWGAHVAQTGQTPFAPGQWGPFLARLAALMALQNVLRPMRFSLAVALTPFVDRIMGKLQTRFNISKPKAFGIMMFLLGSTTSTLLGLALFTVTQINMPKTQPM